MKNYDLITPEGTKDYLFGECIVIREIEDTLVKLFRSCGYSEMLTPGLEFYDVFNLNSRYFPQENLYKLTDSKGRLLVMRPDTTMPIARVVATRLRDAMLPLKLFYNQTVYRTEQALKGRSDEIVQTGIELIGSQLKMSDLEVISTAVSALKSFGMEFSLEIGHIGIFKELVGRLEVSDVTKEKIRKLIETKNFPALNDFLDSLGNSPVTNALKNLPALFGGEEVFE
ncbi:MAG: ATP phosphoribosyltransferase regulatory subunit, partial [Ruminococcus sp.]|nr:ATP phosphoribosyltransferase regulatory subunit [Ruminococcus sp.]